VDWIELAQDRIHNQTCEYDNKPSNFIKTGYLFTN
jgi:hypothetical protein